MAIQLLDDTASSQLVRLSDDYINHSAARGLSPRTLEFYDYCLHSIFLPWCADEQIAELGQLDARAVDRFNAYLLQRPKKNGDPLSKHSVHTWVQTVRQMLTWAETIGETVKAKPQLPRRSKPIRDVLSADEIDLLERIVPTERDKIIIRILGDCGLRREELTQLQSGDIIRSGRQAHLRVLGKGNRLRDVPLPPSLLRRLERHIAGQTGDCNSDRILLSLRRGRNGDYEPLTRWGVYLVVKDACRRARLKKRVFPHLLRHSWMTEMLRRGMNPAQLSVIAGASMEVIMDCYAHLNKEDAYEAMMRALAARRPGTLTRPATSRRAGANGFDGVMAGQSR
jgi:integrase/recombinase XerD